MGGRNTRGRTGYTFTLLELTPRTTKNTKIFELRSKAGGHDLGVVRWSMGHHAYVYSPARTISLTTDDLDSIVEFVERQNAAHAERRGEVQV